MRLARDFGAWTAARPSRSAPAKARRASSLEKSTAMTRPAPAVRVRSATKRFGRHTAVSSLDLDVARNSVYGLLGPNGSGKTTTIRMIMGILHPDEGSVELVGRFPDNRARQRVGYLPEERGVYPKMKVVDLLVFLAAIRGVARAVARARAHAWLERLGLGKWAGKKIETLSKGMTQKIQFIGTVIHEPELLVLDEPFSGLDPINQDLLERVVREFHERGGTVLFSTHLMDHAERLCDRVCLISGSRKVLDGEVRELKRREREGVVAVRFEGDDSWIRGPEVRSVEEAPECRMLVLRRGADPQDLLRRGVACGARINRFELVEPRLHEIFVRHAAGRGGTDDAA